MKKPKEGHRTRRVRRELFGDSRKSLSDSHPDLVEIYKDNTDVDFAKCDFGIMSRIKNAYHFTRRLILKRLFGTESEESSK